jgi:hypothetical protein
MTPSSTRTGRVWTLAILLVAASLLVGSVAASAGAAGNTRAVTAKKKCKKAKKGAVSAKKKKKCKKVHHLALPAPLVRGTISFPSGNVDLNAYDASGNHSGFAQSCPTVPCDVINGIPNTSHSADAFNGGTETFTDNIFVVGGPANREFSYVLCFYTDASVTFTGVTRDGQPQTIPITDSAGFADTLTPPGGPPTPDVNTVC